MKGIKNQTVAMSLVDYQEIRPGDLLIFWLCGQSADNVDKLAYWFYNEEGRSVLMMDYEVELLGEL